MSDKISIVFVCLGNICRSPLAEGTFRHRVQQAGLEDRFTIDSAGTSSYHVGEPPDPGSIRVARERGIDISAQRSRQLHKRDFERFDILIAMDSANHRNMIKLNGGGVEPLRGRLWLMRNFEHEVDGSGHDLDVPDPWGGGVRGFEKVFGIVDRASQNLLTWLSGQHGLT